MADSTIDLRTILLVHLQLLTKQAPHAQAMEIGQGTQSDIALDYAGGYPCFENCMSTEGYTANFDAGEVVGRGRGQKLLNVFGQKSKR